MRTLALLLLPVLCAAPAGARAQTAPHPVFRVTLAPDTTLTHGAPVSGRLVVVMTRNRPAHPGDPLAPGLDPEETWVAAREVVGLVPGASVEIDADSLAAPRAFSAMPAGKRWVMAMLDADHNANWTFFTAGDLVSAVDSIDAPGNRGAPTNLALTRRMPLRQFPGDDSRIFPVEFTSPLLSAFHHRPIVLRAAVVLPPDSEAISGRTSGRFRTVYHIPGWGSSSRMAYAYGRRQVELMREAGERGTAHVFLDPGFPTGHTAFANSANNGPWSDALMRELVPHLEQRFGLIPEGRARFLTGHSSGGWASLWLQVNYPEFFGGTWSTSPDPVDFGDFVGIDVRPGSRDNVYRKVDGSPHPFVRDKGREVGSMEQFTRLETVLGPGGQMASFDAVFSPRGADGEPVPLFDRATGRMDPAVQRAWQAYDLVAILRQRWPQLGPRLAGKLHVFVGGADTFHLEGPTARLCAFLASVGSDATCEVVPGRGHFDLQSPYVTFPKGLEYRFGEEMQRRFDSSEG
jgi:hypothetical protein